MKTAPGRIAKLLAVLSVACFWIIPFSPVLSIAALSTTNGSQGWPRKTAVGGAILCTLYGSLLAALFAKLLFLRVLHGSWAF